MEQGIIKIYAFENREKTNPIKPNFEATASIYTRCTRQLQRGKKALFCPCTGYGEDVRLSAPEIDSVSEKTRIINQKSVLQAK